VRSTICWASRFAQKSPATACLRTCGFGAFLCLRRAMPFGAGALRGCFAVAVAPSPSRLRTRGARRGSVVPLLCASRKAEPFLSQRRTFGAMRQQSCRKNRTLSPSLSLKKGKGEMMFILLIINFLCVVFPFPFLRERARDRVYCERDSSGTTVGHEMPEGDGADSPTQAHEVREAARPRLIC
jgi:hypothetical protein